MKIRLLLFPLLIYSAFSFSQAPNSTILTWMKGDNTINQAGIYGVQGTASASNKPGARDYSATWKDNNGYLWLFGGFGYDYNRLGYLNDLWRYNPSINQWTWIKGDNTIDQFATYGTQGVAGTGNKPGAIYASVSWTDNIGNLWLFGGFGYTEIEFGFLNDLWKFTPSTNKWTWIKGDKTINEPGIYGVQGISNTGNKPGARYGSRTWTDSNGNLWLFGGFGLDNSSTTGTLNDLWKYNPSTSQWTWMKGDNVVDKPGVYGLQAVAADSNKPGARYLSLSWMDNNNNLWLFGGSGFNGNTQGSLNDLWKYNILTDQWVWIKGDSLVNSPGVYGTQGQADINNRPGARYTSVSWTDASGNLWLFGGYGYD
ncbi:MAG: kelch repeat-containing protein, partial [Chitinophagales bacterium]